MNNITESFLMVVAGDIEKLLLESRGPISFAYDKIQTGMKVTLGITFDPTAGGISVSYDLGHDLEPKPAAPEKHKVKMCHVINEAQGDLLDAMNNIIPKKGSGIDSMTISTPWLPPVTLEAR